MNTSKSILTRKQTELFEKLPKFIDEFEEKPNANITSGSVNLLSKQQLIEVTREKILKLKRNIEIEAEKIASIPEITRV